MAKTKSAQPDKAIKSSKDAQVKQLSSVKQGAITKPSQTSKSKSKDIAKQAAVKADKVGKEDKKSKKAKKEPTPDPITSDSEEDDEEEDSSASSSSSDESEAEIPALKAAAKTNGVKINGNAKVASKFESEDEDSDSSESSASSGHAAPAAAAKNTVAGAKEESESEEDSSEDDEEESDEEVEIKGPVDAKALNGKLEEVASKEVSNDCFPDILALATNLHRSLPTRSLAAMLLRPAHLRVHLMKRAKKRRRLLQLSRSARLKQRLHQPPRRPKLSPWVTKRRRRTSSLDVSRTMLTKSGSLANLRALGSCLVFESLLIVTLAVPKGNSDWLPLSEQRLTFQ